MSFPAPVANLQQIGQLQPGRRFALPGAAGRLGRVISVGEHAVICRMDDQQWPLRPSMLVRPLPEPEA